MRNVACVVHHSLDKVWRQSVRAHFAVVCITHKHGFVSTRGGEPVFCLFSRTVRKGGEACAEIYHSGWTPARDGYNFGATRGVRVQGGGSLFVTKRIKGHSGKLQTPKIL